MAKYVKLNDLRSKAIKMFGFRDNKYVPMKAIENAAVEIKSYCVLDGVDDFARKKEGERRQGKPPVFYWADGEEECEPVSRPADEVPVVRCKNCSRRHKSGFCPVTGGQTEPDGYCFRAEKWEG